eukprot:sb/3477345/
MYFVVAFNVHCLSNFRERLVTVVTQWVPPVIVACMLRWWSPWAVLFNDPLALLHISVLNVFLIKKYKVDKNGDLQLWLMQLWLKESISHRCMQLWLKDSFSIDANNYG